MLGLDLCQLRGEHYSQLTRDPESIYDEFLVLEHHEQTIGKNILAAPEVPLEVEKQGQYYNDPEDKEFFCFKGSVTLHRQGFHSTDLECTSSTQ